MQNILSDKDIQDFQTGKSLLNEEDNIEFEVEYNEAMEITKNRFNLGEIWQTNKQEFEKIPIFPHIFPHFQMNPKSWEQEHSEWSLLECWTI